MSILLKMTEEIKYRIPLQILQSAFNNYNEEGWRNAPVSLDELIISKVIRPRLIVDTNIVGGVVIMVPIAGNTILEYSDEYTRVIKVSPDAVNHRTIMTVLSAHYQPYGFNMSNAGGNVGASGLGYGSSNDLSNSGMRVDSSFSSIPIISTATIQLVGYNTVLIRDRSYISDIYSLRCMVANEENLENINPRNWHMLSKLAELCVKSYIYNRLIISMDKAFLSGGQELGSASDIVSSYADAEEMYQDMLRTKIQKLSWFNDSVYYARYLRKMINPGI